MVVPRQYVRDGKIVSIGTSGTPTIDLGTLTLRNVKVTGSSAAFGGGLFIGTNARATASFSEFTGNTATFVANDGDPTSKLRVLAGLKVWF